jgi:putative endonuclease
MTADRRTFGRRAEAAVAKHLEALGYRILARNVRMKFGEIDLVAEKGGVVVIVEVKAGRADPDFPPHLHLDPRKRRKLLTLARAYLAEHAPDAEARIDLVTVTEESGQLRVEQFEDVIGDG